MLIAITFFFLLCIGLLSYFCVAKFGLMRSLPFLLVALWHVLKAPFYLVYPFVSDELFPQISMDAEEVFYLFGIKLLLLTCVFIGYFLVFKLKRAKKNNAGIYRKSFMLLTLGLGLILFAGYVYGIGGLGVIWNDMANRGENIRGYVYLLNLLWIIFGFGVVLSINTIRLSMQLFIVFMVAIITFLAFGSRSLGLGYFIIWFFASIFLNRHAPINLISIRKVPIYLLGLFVFIATPLLRTPDAIKTYLLDFRQFFNDAFANYTELLSRLAVPDIELLVLRHFDATNFWGGSSFFDLRYFFCPISVCLDKPPLDDGVYLYNISLNGAVALGTPVSQLQVSSLPFETWSIGFANFGLWGVVAGGVIQGMLLAFFYNMTQSRNSANRVVGAYSMGLVALGFFHLSNLYFSLFFFPVLLSWLGIRFYYKLFPMHVASNKNYTQ